MPPMLEAILQAKLAHRKENQRFRSLRTAPSNTVDFSSNAYLSFATNAELQQTYIARLQAACSQGQNAVKCDIPETSSGADSGAAAGAKLTSVPVLTGVQSGTALGLPLLGSGGSRLLDGNHALAEDLEHKIAAFHRAPAALLFSSAFDANVGLLSCAPQPGDIVLYDEFIHASVHDGMRLSRAARKIPFAHSSVVAAGVGEERIEQDEVGKEGKRRGLGTVLEDITSGNIGQKVKGGEMNVFICVEGVYSMDGDVASLEKVVQCVDKYLPLGNGYIIVDEAHSVGIFGEQGRGLVSQYNLEDKIWCRVLGFGKAMGCAGGAVLCSPTTRSYLINYARTLIYTTSMAPSSLLSIDIVYDYLMSSKAEALWRNLQHLIRLAHGLLLDLCQHQGNNSSREIQVKRQPPRSPIVPVFTTKPRDLAAFCQARGFMVRPIVAPTVSKGAERVRVCLHAANTKDQVERLCETIGVWTREEPGGEAAEGRILDEPSRSRL